MLKNVKAEMAVGANLTLKSNETLETRFKNKYKFECYGSDGKLKWAEEVYNIVVNEGLDEILNKFWKGSAYSAVHYVGLISTTPTIAATDTMVTHAGWSEITGYSEAVRQTLTLGAVSAQSVNNSAVKAVFNINATVTIGGAFVTTNSTKAGTTGILIGGAAFSTGNRSLISGDILNVTITLTASTA